MTSAHTNTYTVATRLPSHTMNWGFRSAYNFQYDEFLIGDWESWCGGSSLDNLAADMMELSHKAKPEGNRKPRR